MATSYVVDGATLKCSLGGTCTLKVTPGRKTFIQDKPQANVNDYSKKSIPKFSFCSLPKSKRCKPSLQGPWKSGKNDVIIDDAAALMHKSKIMCGRGGIISIQKHNQCLESDGALVFPVKEPEKSQKNSSKALETTYLLKIDVNFKVNADKGAGPLLHKDVAEDLMAVVSELKNKHQISLNFTDIFRSSDKQKHFRELDQNGKKHHKVYKVSSRISPHELGAGVDISNINKMNFDTAIGKIIRKVFSEHNFIWEGINDPCHFTHNKIGSLRTEIMRTDIQDDWKKNWEPIYGAYHCKGHK